METPTPSTETTMTEPSVDPVSTEPNDPAADAPEAVIETEGMNVHYGDFHAVSDVSLPFTRRPRWLPRPTSCSSGWPGWSWPASSSWVSFRSPTSFLHSSHENGTENAVRSHVTHTSAGSSKRVSRTMTEDPR